MPKPDPSIAVKDSPGVPSEYSVTPVHLDDCMFTLDEYKQEAVLYIPSWGQIADGSYVSIPVSQLHNIAVNAWKAISEADLSDVPDDEGEFKHASQGDRLEQVAKVSVAESFSKLDSRYLTKEVEKLVLDNLSVPYNSEITLARTKASNGGGVFGAFRPTKAGGPDPAHNLHSQRPTSLSSRADTIKGISNSYPCYLSGDHIQFRPEVALESGAKRELSEAFAASFASYMSNILDSSGEGFGLHARLVKDLKARKLSERCKTLLGDKALSWLQHAKPTLSDTRYGSDWHNSCLFDVSRFKPALAEAAEDEMEE